MSNQQMLTQPQVKDKSELEKFHIFYEFVEVKSKKSSTQRPLQR